MTRNSLRLVAVLAVLLPSPALAYIGPGAGLGAIAVVITFLVGLLLLVVGLVWYPLKRMFKSRRDGTAGNGKTDGEE